MKFFFATALVIVFTLGAFGQDNSVGVRVIVHPTVALNENWSAVGWYTGNFRTEIPNNMNMFLGVGYRSGAWSLESMVQRQWKVGRDDLLCSTSDSTL